MSIIYNPKCWGDPLNKKTVEELQPTPKGWDKPYDPPSNNVFTANSNWIVSNGSAISINANNTPYYNEANTGGPDYLEFKPQPTALQIENIATQAMSKAFKLEIGYNRERVRELLRDPIAQTYLKMLKEQ